MWIPSVEKRSPVIECTAHPDSRNVDDSTRVDSVECTFERWENTRGKTFGENTSIEGGEMDVDFAVFNPFSEFAEGIFDVEEETAEYVCGVGSMFDS